MKWNGLASILAACAVLSFVDSTSACDEHAAHKSGASNAAAPKSADKQSAPPSARVDPSSQAATPPTAKKRSSGCPSGLMHPLARSIPQRAPSPDCQ